jgi:hypothetical protein
MNAKVNVHEHFGAEPAVRASSNRVFGSVFAVVLAAIGLAPLRAGDTVHWWTVAGAGACLAVALWAPALLAPLNRAWTRLGQTLHRITNPIVLGVLFYTVFTPFGLIARLAGWDPLRKRIDPSAPSYWVRRDPPGPTSGSMIRQF